MVGNGEEMRARLTELGRARCGVYGFLGSAYLSPPSQRMIDALGGEEFRADAAELFGVEAQTSLKQYADSAAQIANKEPEARQEFINLFKVPGPMYVTPYESVFRDARDVGGKRIKGLLMGKSATEVQKWYQLAALQISEEYKDLPDHIGLELNFLSHVCGKEAEYAAEGDHARLTRAWEIERDFLAAHVVSWGPALRDKIIEKTRHVFFRTVASLLVGFTRRDLATLENVVGASTGTPLPEYEAIA